jgi:hypothetical protein
MASPIEAKHDAPWLTQLRQAANPQPHDRLLQNLTHEIALDRSGHIGLVDIDGWSEASTGKYERWI